jgi:iron complex outermembrane receptor protein
LPLIVTALGNPAVKTETLVDAELGYRLEIGTTASIDATGFMGHYDQLITHEVAAPVVQFVPSPQVLVSSQDGNQLKATTRGLEVAGHWSPAPAWRVDGSYTAFHLTPQLAATSLDPLAATSDGNAPSTQWQLRSAWSPSPRVTFALATFRVGPLKQLQVPAYTRADVNAEWRFTNRLSIMAIGQNLLDPAHAEFGGIGSLLQPTQVPRSASLRLRWTF